MSLSKEDLADIRDVVLEALEVAVNPRLDRIEALLVEHSTILAEHTATLAEHSAILNEHTAMLTEHGRRLTAIEQRLGDLDGRVKALENDIKELYGSAEVSLQANAGSVEQLAPEDRLRQLHADVLSLARQLHVTL